MIEPKRLVERLSQVPASWKRAALLIPFGLLLAAYLAAFAIIALRYEGRFSPDSVVYVDTARNILAGNGIARSLVPLDEALTKDIVPPQPMTMWAPLYPLLIALLAKLGFSVTHAALLIPVVSFAVLVAATFLVLRRFSGIPGAIFGVALLILFQPMYDVASAAWSESTALAFAMLFFWLAADRNAGGPRVATAGIMAGLAFAARYAMLPLALIAAIACIRPDARTSLRRICAFCIGFAAIAAPVIARNLLFSGATLGEHVPRERFGSVEVCVALFRILANEMRFIGPFLITIIAVLGLAATCLYAWDLRKAARVLREAFREQRQYLLLLWAVLYAALLVRSEVRVAIDPINDRLLVPGSMFLVLFASVLVSNLARSFDWLLSASGIVLLAVTLAGLEPMAATLWNSRVLPPHVHDASRIPTFSWVKEHAAEDDLLIAEDCFKLPLYAGPRNMLYLESHLPPAKPLQYDDLCAYLAKHRDAHKHVYLILRAGRASMAPRVAEWGTFLNEVDAGKLESYPGIAKEATLEDGSVFRIDPVQR